MDSDDEDTATNEAILQREAGLSGAPASDAVSAVGEGLNPVETQTETSRSTSDAPKVYAPSRVTTADPFAQGEAKKFGKAPAFGGASGTAAAPVYSSFGRRSETVSKVVRDKQYASFEKHTKGIGMKLLQKMGWNKGDGLGKAKQGILRPVDVKVRRRGEGLQDEGERTEQAKEDMPTKADIESQKEKVFKEELRQWKAKPDKSGRAKKPKYSYKTVEEIAAEGSAAVPETSSVKIVDMRGPEARVYTGYDQMGRESTAGMDIPPSGVGCRELVHNVGVYVDYATSDVQKISAKMRKEERQREALAADEAKMSSRVKQEQVHIRRLTEILEVVDHCRRRNDSADSNLTLAEVTEVLDKLKRAYVVGHSALPPLLLPPCAHRGARISRYPKEYEVYSLAKLAGALLLPVMKTGFAGWEPLSEPTRCQRVVLACRSILGDDGVGVTAEGTETMSLFETLCWDHVVPHLRTALGRWEPRDVDPAVALVEAWESTLPKWMITSVLEQVVLPKLQAAVDDWSPTSDAPAHTWLHPWLPVLGLETMAPLFPPIRFKLANVLQTQGWHPNDASAVGILAPWKGVFSPKEFGRFLGRCVTPKLAAVLRDELQVTPSDQDIRPIQWVLAWADLYQSSELSELLDAHLAHKLLRAAAQWLSTDGPNYAEVLEWYRGWKSLFGPALTGQAPLNRLFTRVADMLNRAALVELGAPNPPRKQPAAPAAKREADRAGSNRPTKRVRQEGPDLGSVRNLVQGMAHDRGLEFAPKEGRTTEDGSELYTLGKLTMYVERGVIFARKPKEEYAPVSIDELMAMAS